MNKEVQEIAKILKKIDELVDEYRNKFSKLVDKDKILAGGIVLGIYSPTEGLSVTGAVGEGVAIQGMLRELVSEDRAHRKAQSLQRMVNEVSMRESLTKEKPDREEGIN